MGGKQGKCTVANLNYSGIYLSPFQYYGIDNWQQLECIGKIFEQQLKAEYSNIKQQTQKIIDYSKMRLQSQRIKKIFEEQHQKSGSKLKQQSQQMIGKSYMKDEYNRTTFTWNIGDIDKDIHNERYSPLYTSNQNIQNSSFAGIIRQNDNQWLANQRQFFQKWYQTFAAIEQNKKYSEQVVKTAKKSQNFQKYHCCMLDFLCYKSIILFLYVNLKNSNQFYIDYRHQCSQNTFQDITKDKEYHPQLIKQYKHFMHTYFQRIDTKTKIQFTIKSLFNRNGPDILVFTQATAELRYELQKNNDFFLFGPVDKKNVNQTLLLVKRNLPFKQFDQQLLQQQSSKHMYSNDLKRIKRKINQKEHISLLKIEIEQFIKQYFQEATRIELNKLLSEILEQPQPIIQKLCQYFTRFQIDSVKVSLQIQLECYIPKIIEYCKQKIIPSKKQKQQQNVQKLIQKLKKEGILYWAKNITFSKFKDDKEKQLLIGAFHLSSKPQTNAIEVQILGLIIYHLLITKQYNFIFAGDFNSQISLTRKNNCPGLFQMTKILFELSEKDINSLTNKVNHFPKHSKIVTTKKKRTILQPQVRKANEMAEKCIDLILTSYPIKSDLSQVCQIGLINTRKNMNQNLLPHKQHPYDHFLVQATLNWSQIN